MTLRNFLSIRHGETDWNKEGRFQGRSDIRLNKVGIAQANAAAEIVKRVEVHRIVSSPLSLAHATAGIVANQLGLPIELAPGLVECNFGSLEGVSISDVMRKHGLTSKESLASILPPDGESWVAVRDRSLAALRSAFNRWPNETLLFIAHDAVMQSIAEQLCGRWFENKHACPYRFDKGDGGWTVREI